MSSGIFLTTQPIPDQPKCPHPNTQGILVTPTPSVWSNDCDGALFFRTHKLHPRSLAHTHTRNTRTHTHTHTPTNASTHIHMRAHTHIHMRAHTHIHMRAHTHTHTHTHTHAISACTFFSFAQQHTSVLSLPEIVGACLRWCACMYRFVQHVPRDFQVEPAATIGRRYWISANSKIQTDLHLQNFLTSEGGGRTESWGYLRELTRSKSFFSDWGCVCFNPKSWNFGSIHKVQIFF